MNTQVVNEIACGKTNHELWTRLAYMVIFALLLQLAGILMWVVCIMQFLFVLVTGSDNINLRALGNSLSVYFQQVLQFVSYNTEQKPFPFSAWPASPQAEENSKQNSVEEPKPQE